MYSSRYHYDKQCRKTLTIRTAFNHSEDRTETSYNDQGDIAKEIAQFSQTGTGKEQADRIYSSEVLYSYEYDSNGNWTVKRSTSRALPDGQPRDLMEVRRSIEYY